jgi:hypothetical protein
MQVAYRMNQGFQNNYTTEYYDEYYDFDCEEPQYEYEDAAGNPYLDTMIPAPSLSYVVARVAQQEKIARQQEKARKLKEAAAKARHEAYEAKIAAEEAKYREQKRAIEQLSFFRSKLNSLSLDEISRQVRENVYTDANEAKIANEVFLSKLPRFSTAGLAKMKAEEKKRNETEASDWFYTWRKGNTASSTSHNAWGHRRNGGGKGHKESLQEMNGDAYIQRAAARRARRKANAEKEEKERSVRAATIARINAQIAASTAAAVPPPPAPEPVEETEWQKFKREELEAFRTKVATTEYNEDVKTKEVTKAKVTTDDWTEVAVKKNKNAKIAAQIEKSLYAAPVVDAAIIAEVVAPKPMSKKVTATIMCRSVAKKEKCPHPPGKCNFAHAIDELKPRNCINMRCHFVKNVGGKYINNGKKVCAYLHEGETKHNLCRRIGVEVTDAVSPMSQVVSTAPVQGLTPMSTRVLKPYSKDRAWAPLKKVPAISLKE